VSALQKHTGTGDTIHLCSMLGSERIRFPKKIEMSQEDANDREISGFLTYLKCVNFSKSYHDEFLDWINKLQALQRASFNFTPSNRGLGFLSFKEWAENTRIWCKENLPT
jgi:hypothetical protein